MNKSYKMGSEGIQPINGESKYSFRLKDLRLLALEGWPPYDPTQIGWFQAEREMKKHWDLLSSIPIWCPYPIQAYCIGAAQAPSLIDALSDSDGTTSTIVQDSMNEYFKIHIRYFLFPLTDSLYQDQAVAQLICETLPDAQIGNVKAWVDALAPNELTESNWQEIKKAAIDYKRHGD